MFFFFFFFEQEIIDTIKYCLQGDESLVVGEIKESYAYDYYLPKGCKLLGFPEKTAIEIKKNLAPGMYSILLSDAKKAHRTGELNQFLIIFEKGVVYPDWIPEEINSFVFFLSKDQLKAKIPASFVIDRVLDDWRTQRELRIMKLRKEITEGQSTLFVGAGLSSSLGVPGWGDMLKGLHKYISKGVMNYPNYGSIKKDSNGSYLITARYLNNTAEKEKLKFVSAIRKRLYRRACLKSEFLDAVIELLKLNRVGEVITYNYDTLLEQRMTEVEIFNCSVDGENKRVRNALPVMHVHGLIDPKDTGFDKGVVLSEDEYHKLYSESFHWANVAQLYALTHTTSIFVGLSMTDPNLRRLLDIAYQQGSQDVDHYAFLIRSEFECYKETEAVFSQMGVNIIWCEDWNDVPKQIMRVVN